MSVTVYGIKNCDTMKKARDWLDRKGVTYDFSRLQGREAIDRAGISRPGRTAPAGKSCSTAPARRSRSSTMTDKADLDRREGDRPDACPTVDDQTAGAGSHDGKLIVGFKPEIYEEAFAEILNRRI
jgi:hypothetical protein